MMIYHVYILKSLADGSYYIGYTHDVSRRLLKHNSAQSGYSSRKKPWEVAYTESFKTKELALRREKYLKRMKNKSFLEKLIRGESG